MASPTIMLADNDPDFLEVAREFLEQNGFRVVCASNPEQAVRLLKEVPIAVALIDQRLRNDADDHDRSGLGVAEETMDVSAAARIIVTTYGDVDLVREALRPRRGGRPLASDIHLKADGLERMLEAAEGHVSRARVFLSYAPPDREQVLLLYQHLEAAGFVPWMDRKDIYGGMDWEHAVRSALEESDFVVVCLSRNSRGRHSQVASEIRATLELSDQILRADAYLIPVRLDSCEIADERLERLSYVDLFERNGFQQLARALATGMSRRNQSR